MLNHELAPFVEEVWQVNKRIINMNLEIGDGLSLVQT